MWIKRLDLKFLSNAPSVNWPLTWWLTQSVKIHHPLSWPTKKVENKLREWRPKVYVLNTLKHDSYIYVLNCLLCWTLHNSLNSEMCATVSSFSLTSACEWRMNTQEQKEENPTPLSLRLKINGRSIMSFLFQSLYAGAD